MKNTFKILFLCLLVPNLSSAQTEADPGVVSAGNAISEKTLLVFFVVSAVLLFLAGKFMYDQVFRKKY